MTLLVSELAKEDFENIKNYTFRQWGEQQMHKYEQLLNNGLIAIVQNPFSPVSE